MDHPTDIDAQAPVLAEHVIDIAAPREVVWAVQTDVAGWTGWSPDIVRAETPGPLAPGVTFHWESFDFPVPSTVYAVDEPARVLWGGEAGGIMGIHEWRFAATPGGTRVTTRESWSGDPVTADVERAQQALDHSLVSWLDALRAEAERRASS